MSRRVDTVDENGFSTRVLAGDALPGGTSVHGDHYRPVTGEMDCAERPHFGRIDFERLPNTRDLGGLPAAGGRRVRRGLLLRSGLLCWASDDDLRRLRDDYHLRAVVDFRGADELAETPDPMRLLPGARLVHADVLNGVFAGITQSAESRRRFQQLKDDVEDPAGFLAEFYPHHLTSEAGIAAYALFIRTILETDDGAVLWHCHVGRDRCGMGSMLIEGILGVPMPAMEDDYLATNLYTDEPSTLRADANLRFIRLAVAALKRQWGGIDGYVRDALGVTDADVAELRARYLE